jgi:hypothetical protein
MRTESERPMRNGGWFHLAETKRVTIQRIKIVQERPAIDFYGLLRAAAIETTLPLLNEFAAQLGVRATALDALGACWFSSHEAWAFPMRDANDHLIGIRLRRNDGTKSSIRWSHSGMFIPNGTPGDTLWITEGPTDCAAALTIGRFAIGRPSCLGCESLIAHYVKKHKFKSVTVIADQGVPGQRGAEKLAKLLGCDVWTPDAKDLREFVKSGGTA